MKQDISQMPRLLMIVPAPVIEGPTGQVKLDKKFVEGMRRHVAEWDGPVTCIMRRGATQIPFGQMYNLAELDFELNVTSPNMPFDLSALNPGDLIFASTDAYETLQFVEANQRPNGVKIVYTVENTLDTRVQIVWYQPERGLLRKLHSTAWLWRQEPRLKKALRLCDGFQVNGYPAFLQYGSFNDNAMLYFDGRVTNEMLATEAEMSARDDYLRSDAPVRIVHSGRLEPLKGGQDLIPIAAALRARGTDFTLDIFGSGSLENKMKDAIASEGLESIVRMHGAVDFETELVPFLREKSDMFLSCHRQSDPSCTYLESLGCGIPIVGYDNAMWSNMANETGGGWAVSLGEVGDLAAKIQELSIDRSTILEASRKGLEFARGHCFEAEFSKRMQHLAQISQSN